MVEYVPISEKRVAAIRSVGYVNIIQFVVEAVDERVAKMKNGMVIEVVEEKK